MRRDRCGVRSGEEAERFRVVIAEHVLDLLIVVQGLLVGLAAVPGLLVSAEPPAGRVLVVGVDPDASSLDVLAGLIG
jgi:hypothetical protein